MYLCSVCNVSKALTISYFSSGIEAYQTYIKKVRLAFNCMTAKCLVCGNSITCKNTFYSKDNVVNVEKRQPFNDKVVLYRIQA